MEQIRSFVAIELEENVKGALGKIQQTLWTKGIEGTVRWVRPEGMHLTLKFLGNVPSDRIRELELAVAAGSRGIEPFSIGFSGLGCFPTAARPNVIWVGVEGDTGKLATLQGGIEDHLKVLGYPPEKRKYTPHLTLGRVGRNLAPSQRRRIGGVIEALTVGALGEMQVREVKLMGSTLSPSGATYTQLANIKLKECL